jgi:hypothetical protein
MNLQGLEWEPAKLLLSKAIVQTAKPIKEEMTLSYELEYPKFLEEQAHVPGLADEDGREAFCYNFKLLPLEVATCRREE